MVEPILNRWRGTGKIIGPVTGTNLYALYIAIVVSLVSEWYWGVLAGLAFIVGESMS